MQRYKESKANRIATIFLSVTLFAFCIFVAFSTMRHGEKGVDVIITNNSKPPDETKIINTVAADAIYNGNLVLVNDIYECKIDKIDNLQNCYQYPGNKDNRYYYVKNQSLELRSDVLAALNLMSKDFNNVYNKDDLMIESAYQDYITLEKKYNDDPKNSVKPGYSEFMTGYSVNLMEYTDDSNPVLLTGEGNYSWVKDNAFKYGFVLRYPENRIDKTGHEKISSQYRYVGQPHASVMHDNSFCLEEYIEYIKEYTFDNPLIATDCNNQQYILYYQNSSGETTDIKAPVTDYTYADSDAIISGDNMNGYIVTIKAS